MFKKGLVPLIIIIIVTIIIGAGVGGFLVLREKEAPVSQEANQQKEQLKIEESPQPRLDNLCIGEESCNNFCKNSLTRCKEYCGSHSENAFCQKAFSFELTLPAASKPVVLPEPPPPPKPVQEAANAQPPIVESPPVAATPRIAESQTWAEDAMTQPVPPGASKTRLVLPAPIEKIILKKIGAFGAHQGGHPEGLDHEWFEIKNDAPLASWGDGKVAKVYRPNPSASLRIRIDYGDGLWGEYMEIETPLVKEGDQVQAGQPVGFGSPSLQESGYQGGEFTLADEYRRDGVKSWIVNSGVAVSPFDYLREDVKKELVAEFTKQVIEPYIAKGQQIETVTPWEPYLTNRMMLHKNHKGKVVGEWLLKSKPWEEVGPYELLTFLPPNPKYYPDHRALAIDTTSDQLVKYFSAPAEIDYAAKQMIIKTDLGNLYAIFELDESGPRSLLKIEHQTGSYPPGFSANAEIYIEREPIGARTDAYNLGVRPHP